jgi:hypothetical protein
VTTCHPSPSASGMVGLAGAIARPGFMRRASAMKEEAAAESSRATRLRTLGPALSTIGALPFRTASAKDTADEAPEKRPPSEEEGLKRNQSGVSSPPAREKAAALGLIGRATDRRKRRPEGRGGGGGGHAMAARVGEPVAEPRVHWGWLGKVSLGAIMTLGEETGDGTYAN